MFDSLVLALVQVLMHRMKVVDLFAGLGGFSAGAIAAGAEVILGVDHDPVPLKLWSWPPTPKNTVFWL